MSLDRIAGGFVDPGSRLRDRRVRTDRESHDRTALTNTRGYALIIDVLGKLAWPILDR